MRYILKSQLLVAAAIGVAIAGADSAALAQVPVVKPGDDLRPLQVTTIEIAEGKRLADANCVSCHGAYGVSNKENIPNLAGQRPAYLYIELKAYQAGNLRNDALMNAAVKFLSEDALVKVAAYFGSLDPAPPPSGPARATKPDAVAAGKAVAASCAGCHGDTGVTQVPGMPSLIGLDPKYLLTAMQAYKSGQRKNDMMKGMLAPVPDVALGNVALYFALQTPARAKTPAAGDADAGKAAAGSCGGCHGDTGVSGSPATPSLAGQDAQYLVSALQAYKAGTRSDETMKGMAAALDDKAMKNLAAFYAAQEPKAPNVRRPLSTEEWTQRCDRCHGLNGNSTDPRIPMLAGQRPEYLQKALHDYRTHARKSGEMAAMSEGLSEDDVENLANYYSRQRARAVLYVPLPAK
jgi:cytochrome c553